jgi:hypothetical protein
VVFPLVECCYQQPKPTALSPLASVSPWGGPQAGSRHLPALQVLAMPVEHAAGLDQPLMQRPQALSGLIQDVQLSGDIVLICYWLIGLQRRPGLQQLRTYLLSPRQGLPIMDQRVLNRHPLDEGRDPIEVPRLLPAQTMVAGEKFLPDAAGIKLSSTELVFQSGVSRRHWRRRWTIGSPFFCWQAPGPCGMMQ